MNVWLASYDDRENTLICVAASLKAAVAEIKKTHGPPYVAEWGELVRTDEDFYSIEGKFQSVPNYSTAHTQGFVIERYEVLEG